VTRTLVLVRHAKAVTADVPDVSRPLAERGRRDAPVIGRWLSEHGLVPDRVVVSPALRARQTCDLAGLGDSAVVDDRIYDNTVDGLLAVVRETPDDVRTLVLVGHNPSMAGCAVALGGPDTAARREVSEGFPTSAVAVVTLDVAWSDAVPGSGTVTDVAAPRG
jgi:phosphohistidine phosphatase